MSTSALGSLNCGYCRAPLVDHDLMALKICNHRLTGNLATARADAIGEAIDVVSGTAIDHAVDTPKRAGVFKAEAIAALEQLKEDQESTPTGL